MKKLFETFITALLRREAATEWTVSAQSKLYLGEGGRMPMRPDILLRHRDGRTLIADCKYKRIQPDEFKNHDVYQLLAYCTAEGIDRGLLLYPSDTGPINGALHILNSAKVIGEMDIQLGYAGADFGAECRRFARRVFEWA